MDVAGATDNGGMIRTATTIASLRVAIALVLGATLAGTAGIVEAGYPVLSWFTRTADGPYQPQVRRFTVVDPTPVTPQLAVGRHGQAIGHHRQADTTLWARREAGVPAYPYGWFGARHSTEFSSRGSFYDDYEQTAILRGR
jgi:hypothetical protein